MNAEIISTGAELLLGHTVNTNATLIARELAAYGHSLKRVTTTGDNKEQIEEAIRQALARSDLVIITGGLGPTPDDLTRDAAANALGRTLVEDSTSREKLEEYFGARNISSNQFRQALFPEGALILENNAGTAPGCIIEDHNKYAVLLPGPPRELEPMLLHGLAPLLKRLSSDVIITEIIRLFGIGEGDAAEKLGDLLLSKNPVVATYADNDEIHLKISAKAKSVEEAEKLLQPTLERTRMILGDFCYGEEKDSLESIATQLLITNHKTIATAESCTGGWLAQHITACPGSSEIFHLGVVSYANEAKNRILKVPEEVLRKYGAVSPQCAKSMAHGIRELALADLGISITGIAGPDGGSADKPLGLVYLCLADRQKDISVKIQPKGKWPGRERTRLRAVKVALDMLRRHLLKLPVSDEYYL